MLEELQALDEGQPETPVPTVESCPLRYLEPFLLAILCEYLHHGNDGFLERTMHPNWLEPSEEDPLVYIVGNEANKNPPQCILDIASVDQDGKTYILIKMRSSAWKNLANESNEVDSESSDEEETDDDNREDDDDQPQWRIQTSF